MTVVGLLSRGPEPDTPSQWPQCLSRRVGLHVMALCHHGEQMMALCALFVSDYSFNNFYWCSRVWVGVLSSQTIHVSTDCRFRSTHSHSEFVDNRRRGLSALTADAKGVLVRPHSTQGPCNPSMGRPGNAL